MVRCKAPSSLVPVNPSLFPIRDTFMVLFFLPLLGEGRPLACLWSCRISLIGRKDEFSSFFMSFYTFSLASFFDYLPGYVRRLVVSFG